MITLDIARENIGRKVIYTPYLGCDALQLEEGYITSVNDHFVFVDYGKSCGRGIATCPQDLDFLLGD